MQCPRCQQDNPAAQKFCRECGTPLQRFSGSVQPAPSYADVQRSLNEALEQQRATSEILRVISGSLSDVQPVLDAVAESAARLCGATDSLIMRVDAGLIRRAAHFGPVPSVSEARPVTPHTPTGRAIVERRVIHIHDILEEFARGEYEEARALQHGSGFRTVLCVPLVREEAVIGAIVIRRVEARPFAETQVELVSTFADQAVIAIENVRLFKELETRNRDLTEALDQQKATSEILRVISSSPTDTQPVFDTIAANAARLCSANDSQVLRVDGDELRLVAASGTPSMPSVRRLTRGHLVGRAVIDRETIHVRDLAQALAEYPETTALQYGVQSALAVPLLREGVALGVIRISRTAVLPFTDKQIALLKTFADQAVIAIENVRLFKELETRNRDLTEALAQQTATGEILSIISRSPTDVRPVFDTIIRNAVRLCDGINGSLYRFDGELIHLIADVNVSGKAWDEWGQTFPRPLSDGGGLRHVIETGQVLNVADVGDWEGFTPAAKAMFEGVGVHSNLLVPMLRQAQAIGVIGVTHRNIGAFSEARVELLKTFANQAVIAIENVRLFTELQASNRELTTALDTQTATSDILRVISQSQTDVQPVFDAIVDSAMRLLHGISGALYRLDGDVLHLVAYTSTNETGDAAFRELFPRPLAEATFQRQSILERAPYLVSDVETDPRANEQARRVFRARGYRSVVYVPMFKDGAPIGNISVARRESGTFTDDEVALLQTFADQAVIAIENVRLFKELEASNREIADKSRQLEVASQHKSEFLANMSHELRTPLNAIIGFSEVLSDRMFGELNEKQEEYLKDIYASGTHLLSLINDILDLSKIEAGRMELELTDFHLPTALDNALTLVRERAGRRSITLQMTVDERLGEVRADERKIRQVVLNLLSNAIKFTPEGGRIEIAAVPKDGSVEVSVSDTGVGIAPEDQEAVFEEFRQVGTADKKAEGTGLGLTLCRKFIELHGGRIWVKSQLGAGSTFTFTIPVRPGA